MLTGFRDGISIGLQLALSHRVMKTFRFHWTVYDNIIPSIDLYSYHMETKIRISLIWSHGVIVLNFVCILSWHVPNTDLYNFYRNIHRRSFSGLISHRVIQWKRFVFIELFIISYKVQWCILYKYIYIVILSYKVQYSDLV